MSNNNSNNNIKILLNGKPYQTASTTLYELLEEYKKNNPTKTNDFVTIINGFQTNENVQLEQSIQVSIIEKGVMPSKDELEFLMSSRHTPNVHNKVKASRVAIAGLGGLGSNIAVMLARTGVGTLHLIDFDIVEPSNLNRQHYCITHLGLHKTEALKQQLLQINPYVNVILDTIKITKDNCITLFKDDDIICEAFDKPNFKAMLSNIILENYPEKTLIAASGMAGYGSSNTIKTRKITNKFYICGDGETSADFGMGLMAPRVNICAGHQANMILRKILGIDEI